MKRPETTAEFTLGDDDYQVLRYSAPETRDEWVLLFQSLLRCTAADAAVAYDTMFPEGYDPDSVEDAALVLGESDAGGAS